jgi:hypothetical protein
MQKCAHFLRHISMSSVRPHVTTCEPLNVFSEIDSGKCLLKLFDMFQFLLKSDTSDDDLNIHLRAWLYGESSQGNSCVGNLNREFPDHSKRSKIIFVSRTINYMTSNRMITVKDKYRRIRKKMVVVSFNHLKPNGNYIFSYINNP